MIHKILQSHASQRIQRQFLLKNIPESQSSLRIIVEHSIQIVDRLQSKSVCKNRFGYSCIFKKIQKLSKLRKAHVPIQYIVGEWPFRYINLKMKRPILIPRFETEFMVGFLIQQIQKKWQKGSTLKIVDYGCGTGAISLSLLSQLKSEYKISINCVDIRKQCLQITQKNARKNNISQDIRFIHGDMLNHLNLIDECDVIVSNPPYVKQSEFKKLKRQIKQFEDYNSIVGGEDGLKFIRPIVQYFQSCTHKNNKILSLQYDGTSVQQLEIQHFVKLDQYDRRRFILIN